jgi:phage terminase small subunit
MSHRKPAALKRLEGNPGQYPIEDYGIEALGTPFCPEHLPDDARGVFEIVKASMPAKVYSALDSFTLAAYAMAWAIHKRAVIELSNPGFDPSSPWLKALNQQAAMLASLGDRLGLSPKSRTVLKLPSSKQQESKFAGLIGQAGSTPGLPRN